MQYSEIFDGANINAQKLAQYVRYWHRNATQAEVSVETALKEFAFGGRAIDILLCILADRAQVCDHRGESRNLTLDECCKELLEYPGAASRPLLDDGLFLEDVLKAVPSVKILQPYAWMAEL